jgi:hypothetical protein
MEKNISVEGQRERDRCGGDQVGSVSKRAGTEVQRGRCKRREYSGRSRLD